MFHSEESLCSITHIPVAMTIHHFDVISSPRKWQTELSVDEVDYDMLGRSAVKEEEIQVERLSAELFLTP